MYECEDCQKTFSNKSNLNRHWKITHREEEAEEESDYSEEEVMDETVSSDEEEDSDNENFKIDIWRSIINECEYRELSITELYKEKVLFSKSLKMDDTHKAIMRTLQKAQEEENMDFHEALDYAIDKRKFLIQRKLPMVDDDSIEE